MIKLLKENQNDYVNHCFCNLRFKIDLIILILRFDLYLAFSHKSSTSIDEHERIWKLFESMNIAKVVTQRCIQSKKKLLVIDIFNFSIARSICLTEKVSANNRIQNEVRELLYDVLSNMFFNSICYFSFFSSQRDQTSQLLCLIRENRFHQSDHKLIQDVNYCLLSSSELVFCDKISSEIFSKRTQSIIFMRYLKRLIIENINVQL